MGIQAEPATLVSEPSLFDSMRMLLGEQLSNARVLAASVNDENRLAFARGMVFAAMSAYWERLHRSNSSSWRMREIPGDLGIIPIAGSAAELSEYLGATVAKLSVADASYIIGTFYTSMMPMNFRSGYGAYYTPPALCERLLDVATEAGVDWGTARVLDPACGGGAFLSPVAQRMADSLRGGSAKIALKKIAGRLAGFEIDPFAAWMSQVFLEVTLGELCREAGKRLPMLVRVCNALDQEPGNENFDLVIGNPPYGRITLSQELREKYCRSLFGHANLYGVFTDLALRFTRRGGVIAYVTPTSFLAGEYFKALRRLLGREAPPASIDFIKERKGVFADVLQETMLAAYRRGGDPRVGEIHFISPGPAGSLKNRRAGSFQLPENPEKPWLMPRSESQSELVRKVNTLSYRLADYGYTVSTGPLVWNRHKSNLRDRPGNGRYPLIWAESVRPNGAFEFRALKRNHMPYFEPNDSERWVITDIPCVLLQRTTAKEQCRRLIAAELPESFIQEHGAVVVENHVNMIKPIAGAPKVSPAALAALLNSDVVDQVFRCINGSVAVSAYELEALPLPAPDAVRKIEPLLRQGIELTSLERAIERLYY